MSEEDQTVGTTVLPKFDMPSSESTMTAQDVKSLTLRHGIPLDLHPVALTKGLDIVPSIFRETFSGLKGWKKIFLFLEKRATPDAMAWRHHDSDVNDPVPEDGFSASDVKGGLATTWYFLGFRPIFKDTEGNVVTMSEYLRFPFMSGASISKGPSLTSQDQIPQHTTRPLLLDQTLPVKTDHQKRVEVEDPKIVATRERKARATARKKEKRRQGGDGGGGGGSCPTTKRRKTAARKDGPAASEATSSPEPLRTINPTDPSGAVAETAESREDRSPHISPHGSANHSIHHYSDTYRDNKETNTLRLGTSGDQSGRAATNVNTKVVQHSPTHQSAYHSPMATQPASPPRSIQREMLRKLMVHLAPPATQGESNALNNATALERAWFSLARGALAQTDILERFEHLQLILTSSPRPIQNAKKQLENSFRLVKSEHEGYARKLEVLESRNSELSQVNKEKALRIKELEDELARKDSALVYAERLNAERAQKKEKLVAQFSKTEMEKFDCIRKLLPTVVEHLLQSHEYKHSLSKPFNLAIQAGWGKGLSEERSEEDLLELMCRMENFDAYDDKKMCVEYDKLFEKRYPYVEKVSRGFRHSVSDLLKVYPDSPPSGQAPPSKPFSKKDALTSAP
ncbi:hypothetical protein Tco_1329415 [Tanacetum coccineum]